MNKGRPNIIVFCSNKLIQGLRNYPFMISLDRCDGSCNTFDYLSNRIYAPNKTKVMNLSVLNMITRKNFK